MNFAIFSVQFSRSARTGQQAGEHPAGLPPDADRGGIACRSDAPALLRSNWLKVGLVGGLSLLALAVVAAQFRGEPISAGAPVPPVAASMSPQAASSPLPISDAPSPVEPILAQGSGPAIDSSPLHASSEAHPVEPVRWQGSELMIDLDQVPLPKAIDLLARATNTAVTGVQLLQQPVPVTMHWRFSDVTNAWQHLLQSHAGFSMSCGASDCQVWIASEMAMAAAAEAPNAERALPAAAAAPESSAAAAAASTPPTELERSQPGGSC